MAHGPQLLSYTGMILMLRSTAGTECVSAPTEMKSTPVSAYARMFSSVMPPEASNGTGRLDASFYVRNALAAIVYYRRRSVSSA